MPCRVVRGVKVGPKPKPVLTIKQRLLVKWLSKGYSLKESAIKAGYKPHTTNGSPALKTIREKFPELLARLGLTDEAVVKRFLLPAMRADDVKLAQFEGKFTDRTKVPNWSARLAAMDVMFNLKGAFPKGPLIANTINNQVVALSPEQRAEARAVLARIKRSGTEQSFDVQRSDEVPDATDPGPASREDEILVALGGDYLCGQTDQPGTSRRDGGADHRGSTEVDEGTSAELEDGL